jgi:hypothetical protein
MPDRQADVCIPTVIIEGSTTYSMPAREQGGAGKPDVLQSLKTALDIIFLPESDILITPTMKQLHDRLAALPVNEPLVEDWGRLETPKDVLYAPSYDAKFARWDLNEGSSKEIVPITGLVYNELAVLGSQFHIYPVGARQISARDFQLYGNTSCYWNLVESMSLRGEARKALLAFVDEPKAAGGGGAAAASSGGGAFRAELWHPVSPPTVAFSALKF